MGQHGREGGWYVNCLTLPDRKQNPRKIEHKHNLQNIDFSNKQLLVNNNKQIPFQIQSYSQEKSQRSFFVFLAPIYVPYKKVH